MAAVQGVNAPPSHVLSQGPGGPRTAARDTGHALSSIAQDSSLGHITQS